MNRGVKPRGIRDLLALRIDLFGQFSDKILIRLPGYIKPLHKFPESSDGRFFINIDFDAFQADILNAGRLKLLFGKSKHRGWHFRGRVFGRVRLINSIRLRRARHQ